LSPDFRRLFSQHSNSKSQLFHVGNCAPLLAVLKKSGEKVQGFLCSGKASSVVYLTLYAPSNQRTTSSELTISSG